MILRFLILMARKLIIFCKFNLNKNNVNLKIYIIKNNVWVHAGTYNNFIHILCKIMASRL
jgi:hypothetical protein